MNRDDIYEIMKTGSEEEIFDLLKSLKTLTVAC
jgi:hypothetical protein